MLFKEKFKSNSKIFLDGGNGSEIANLGGEMTPAFSALATITAPEIVRQVHENFMDAGCDLITANTFSTTRHNMNSINSCLLYTSPSPRDRTRSRMPSSA